MPFRFKPQKTILGGASNLQAPHTRKEHSSCSSSASSSYISLSLLGVLAFMIKVNCYFKFVAIISSPFSEDIFGYHSLDKRHNFAMTDQWFCDTLIGTYYKEHSFKFRVILFEINFDENLFNQEY